jgi:hypothetical protein
LPTLAGLKEALTGTGITTTAASPMRPAYQLEIPAFGYDSGDPAMERIYPWYGFRTGVIGTP